MAIGSVCLIIRHPPYGREDAYAGLRTMLVSCKQGLRTTVVLLDAGVWNLVIGQRASSIGMPSNEDSIYDILDIGGRILTDQSSLDAHGLGPRDIVEGVEVLSGPELAEVILSHDAVLPVCGGF
jgi:sulfur relay (sulfurtransferase) DsrF/TusC family protein